jgi:hypothetical protein
VVGSIKSMKYSDDTIGNRTCDLTACSTVPQPTASAIVISRSTIIVLVNFGAKNVYF